jgi:GMP synthase (glutamine-hydrolysing)
MPTVIALRHVAFEHLGNFAAVLDRRGWTTAYREAPTDDLAAPELDAAELLIVLGGPISAYQEALYPFLREELAVIERRLAAGKPVLGICLGSQLMARALGARVYPGAAGKEIGWAPLALSDAGRRSCLAPLGDGTPVLHWHGDTFDLPPGTVRLGSTPRYENQAFAYERHGLALQCHIEVEAPMLEHWYVGHTCEVASTPGVSVPTLRAESARSAPLLAPVAARCLAAWLEQLR